MIFNLKIATVSSALSLEKSRSRPIHRAIDVAVVEGLVVLRHFASESFGGRAGVIAFTIYCFVVT